MHCHEHRSESWTVVDGTAAIQIGDVIKEYSKGATVSVGEDVKSYKASDSFYITAGNKTVEIEGNGVAIVTKV